jgi:hypothetical protein
MNSSISNSSALVDVTAPVSTAPAAEKAAKASTPLSVAGASRTFLLSMAAGMVATVVAFSSIDEKFLHAGPEYGMSEAHQDHMRAACAAHEQTDTLILGDSRAVAGLSVKDMRAAGIDVDKFALGASGLFAGWTYLDRLLDCGVKPKNVLLAYGLVHMLDTGAIMDRTTNFDSIRGPRARFEYDQLSKAEDRKARQLTYKAVSILGPELSGIDFVLLAPSFRNVLSRPAQVIENNNWFNYEHAHFAAMQGDRYYGIDARATELPQEAAAELPPPRMNTEALKLISQAAREYGFKIYFYTMPNSELAMKGMKPEIAKAGRTFLADLRKYDITALNGLWTLPDDAFGDESHVNPKGRELVTRDLLPRWPSLKGKE